MPSLSNYPGFPLYFFLFACAALYWIPEVAGNRDYLHKANHTPVTAVVDQATAATGEWRKLELVATAYNSVAAQTDSTPDIAAWGDKLKPGMKSIAVSRDLLRMGLTRGIRVQISGLQGEYVVLDKMNKRWRKRIDVYMGEDVKAALNFGKRDVVLRFRTEPALLVAENR